LLFWGCRKKTTPTITKIVSGTDLDLYNSIALPDSTIYIGGGNDFQEHIILKGKKGKTIFYKNNFITSFDKAMTNFSYEPFKKRLFVGGISSQGAFKTATDTNWTPWQQPSFLNITGIAQTNEAVFFTNIASNGGLLYKYDTFFNFVSQKSVSHDFQDIQFANQTNGIACGTGAIMITKNGGETWDYTTAKGDIFNSIAVINESTWYVSGFGGLILKTNNAGASWQKVLPNKVARSIRKIIYEPSAAQIAIVGGDGLFCLLNTINDEITTIKKFTSEDILGAVFLQNNQWILHGTRGNIWIMDL
jgi:Photosynthesis system II assembly factor YCF48